MYIRIRTILVIFFTTLVIISFSVLVGILAVRNGIELSQEADLTLISDIADHYISNEIDRLKLIAAGCARLLSAYEDEQWPDVLAGAASRHPEFTGMAVWDSGWHLISQSGFHPMPDAAMNDLSIKQAFQGIQAISSPIPSQDGLLFYLTAPIPGTSDRILTLSLPYTYFSQMLSTFVIWDTGHIFMDDAKGHLIANPRSGWVEDRVDFLHMADIDAANEEIVNNIRQNPGSNAALIRYSISNVQRLCVYRPVSGSEEGWLLGTVAPLPESPFIYVDNGLLTVGLVSLILSLIAAFIASGFIKRPFEQIAALKEEAESASRFKSDFLANMSHEIRTPMNAILGSAEIMMRDEAAPPSMSEGLSQIYNSGDLLLNIINDLLDLSKIEAGKLELSPSNYDMASLINDTVTLNLMRLGSKEIEFKLSVDENMPQSLFGDDIRIKQIMNNLLSNAFKYTEKGEIRLSVSVESDSADVDNGLILKFSVSDTGQGMTEEQVKGLFDKYTRYEYVANRTIEGTGLGMNITQSLVELMNGRISVESRPGEGSVFTVWLPQGRSDSNVLGRDLAEKLQNFSLAGMRQLEKANIVYESMPYGSILIVDDVESNLFVAKGLMLPYDLTIDTVTSGFKAIDRIKDGNVYDIVFMDHMMPELDGIEATKIMRGLGYSHPIVALTANAVKGQQEIFLSNGFDDFVSKPIDTRHLNSILKRFIRKKQTSDGLEPASHIAGTDGNGNTAGKETQAPVAVRLAEFFIRDALTASAVLESTLEKDGIYEEEDFSAYTISVHSMKSALANVGHYELSAFAGKLETAGRNRDAAVVENETPIFLRELRILIDLFDSEKDRYEGSEAADSDYDGLREKLLTVKNACEDYDRKAAKDAIIGLREKTWLPQIDEHLREMSESLLSGDFDKVAQTADMIIKLM